MWGRSFAKCPENGLNKGGKPLTKMDFQTMEKCFSFLGFLAYLAYLATVISVWFLIVNPPTEPESGKKPYFRISLTKLQI